MVELFSYVGLPGWVMYLFKSPFAVLLIGVSFFVTLKNWGAYSRRRNKQFSDEHAYLLVLGGLLVIIVITLH